MFGAQESSPGGRIVRTIGIVRARAKIGLQNLAYNIRRLVTLEARHLKKSKKYGRSSVVGAMSNL